MEDASSAQDVKTRRERMPFYAQGPGPARYYLPPLLGRSGHDVTHKIAPAYSLRLNLGTSFIPRDIGPGPAAYYIQNALRANGLYPGLAYSLRYKHKDFDRTKTPGPAAYYVSEPWKVAKSSSPAYTMRLRTADLLSRCQTPAANAYILPPTIGDFHPSKHMMPPVSMKGSRISSSEKPKSPGPGRYNIGPVELTKYTSPAFTMRIKWPNLTGSKNPGPAEYNVKPSFDAATARIPSPSYSFGIRYSDFVRVPTTQCDTSRVIFIE